jgi:GDPmannose 4,6-dehydratase
MKSALITGITGQDGAYLSKFLLSKGYKVYGTYRRTSTPNFWRLCHLDVFDKVELIPADVTDMSSILEAINVSQPDEIYNLAAQSFVSASFDSPLLTCDVDGLGTTRILEAIRILNKNIKFYQASTSELFGNSNIGSKMINEDTPMHPASPYAASKIYSYHTIKIYREAYGIFASNGILFNHESPIRGLEFVTRKVTNMVAQIKLGLKDELVVGNIESIRDWGYAEEYVEAMWRILQLDNPDDFVVATGEAHSVEDLIRSAFSRADLDYKKYIRTDESLIRPIDVNFLLGDISKLNKFSSWEPKVKFNQLVNMMVDSDIDRWSKYLNGEIFPWDAPSYPHELKIKSRLRK